MRTAAFVLSLVSAFGAVKPVSPPGMAPSGPYTPGILTDDFLYVSGQGAKDAAGQIPAGREDQLRNALDNVRTVVQAAGLTMDHVVYVQVFLTADPDEGPLDAVFRKFFPQAPPARSTIGVAGLPGTPVEISAVAVRDRSRKKIVAPPGYPSEAVFSAGVIAAGRLYISGLPGTDPQTGKMPVSPDDEVRFALQAVERITKAAGISLPHLVFVNPYLTAKIPMGVMNKIYAGHFEFGNTPARATIQVSALPGGAGIHFTGVAVMDLSRRKAVRPKNMEPSPTASPCVFAGDTYFCSAKSGFIPGPRGGIYAPAVETQLRQTMRNLLDGLEEAGLTLGNVVSSNVYLDDINEFSRFNPVYAEYFNAPFPARTTVQQVAPVNRAPSARGIYPTLEQISIIAVR
ncbi:MAG: RidA family protein [Bryobacterales bacterium]|nr:RidA family protein [Bryobacterales bacterium]